MGIKLIVPGRTIRKAHGTYIDSPNNAFAPSGVTSLPAVGPYEGVSAPTVASLAKRTLAKNQTVHFSGSTFVPFQCSTLVLNQSSSVVADLNNQTSQVPIWADAVYIAGTAVIIRADGESGNPGGGDIDNGSGGQGGRGSTGGGGGGSTGTNGGLGGGDSAGGPGGNIFVAPGLGNPGDGYDGANNPDTGPAIGPGGKGFGYRYFADYAWPTFNDGGPGGDAPGSPDVASAGGGGGGTGGHNTIVCNLFRMSGSFFFSTAGGGGGDYFDNGTPGTGGNSGYSAIFTRAYFPFGSGPVGMDELWAIHHNDTITQVFDYTTPFDYRLSG